MTNRAAYGRRDYGISQLSDITQIHLVLGAEATEMLAAIPKEKYSKYTKEVHQPRIYKAQDIANQPPKRSFHRLDPIFIGHSHSMLFLHWLNGLQMKSKKLWKKKQETTEEKQET